MPELPKRNSTLEVLGVSVLLAAITLFTVIGFAHDWMPPVASRHGVGVDGVLRYLFRATGPILVIGAVAVIGFLWRYGRGRPTASPSTSHKTELLWSIVPVIGMMAVTEVGVVVKGMPVWEEIEATPPANALAIEVTGQQFEWIVRYPGPDGKFGRTSPDLVDKANPAGLDRNDPAALDDIVVRNQLHVPVDQPVYVQLRGRDVLHSFTVAALRVKQDVMPGIFTRALFVPTVVGRYEIQCTQVCGMGHYRMHGAVYVETPQQFHDWLSHKTGWLQQ